MFSKAYLLDAQQRHYDRLGEVKTAFIRNPSEWLDQGFFERIKDIYLVCDIA